MKMRLMWRRTLVVPRMPKRKLALERHAMH